MNDPAVSLRFLVHRFPESGFTLRIPDLDIYSGEILAVIGPNGAGKSTLLRLAAGILHPESGSIQLLGRNLSGLDRRTAARSLGYLPQNLSSNSDYRVEELAALGRYPHLPPFGSPGTEDRRIIEESLRSTEMEKLRRRRLSHLSGGERKRAFLASVLAQNPRILLLDEPAASLDLHRQGHFFRLLTGLARKGMGIAVVTHDLNLAALFSRRVLLLKDGSPLAEGPPDTVLSLDNLESAYGPDIWLGRHPQTGRPIVLPGKKDDTP